MSSPATTTSAAATLTGVSKTFGSGPTAVHALADVDLEVAAGELTVVLGPSGSGKTTLLNLVGGIQHPTQGRVVVAGHDLSGLDQDELTDIRRDTVGFVFQFFNLVPTLTARENVALIAELTDGDREAVGDRVEEVLRRVGLAARGDHFPGQLSGGEQQRVAIARAVVKQPPVLLCDEPTGALDIETGRTILELLRQEARDAARTVVIVTHNAAIGAMADRVLRLRSGRIERDTRNDHPVDPSEVDW
jgi:putative ABC transport system ATP-binding protein